MGSGVSKQTLQQRHVVIIGGGYGGCELAVLLQKWGVPFTLIDPKAYFHLTMGALRATVDPSYMKKTTIAFKPTFRHHFIQGTVTEIDLQGKKVTIGNGDGMEILMFTELVVAVGSRGPMPGKIFERRAEDASRKYRELGNEIDKATNVIIVGGGAVGVELAGEIAERYSAKLVSIIHRRSYLVSPSYGDQFQRKVKNVLKDRSVQALLDESVTNFHDLTIGKFQKQTVKTSKGQLYAADIVLDCTGLAPETSLTRQTFDASKFDNKNRLKVTPQLLIAGETNIYAIGDCCNTSEEKLAAHACAHARTVAHNIWRDIKNKEKKTYRQTYSGTLVSIGAKSGAGVINGFHFFGFVVGWIFGRGLFTSRFWNNMDQQWPN